MRVSIVGTACGVVLMGAGWTAAEVSQDRIGTYSGWSGLNWRPMAGINDGANEPSITDKLDFIGDATSPGGYWAVNNDYVFYRMRVAGDTNITYDDTLQVVIDRAGVGTVNVPDYAFAWDSRATPVTAHGLEMQDLGSSGTTWGSVTMDDLDNSNSSKTSVDINGAGRTTDGYVRTVQTDGKYYVDMGVSWSYLKTNVSQLTLSNFGDWRIAFSSLGGGNDHNALGLQGDISGGVSTASELTVGWASNNVTVISPTVTVTPSSPSPLYSSTYTNYTTSVTGDVIINLTGPTSSTDFSGANIYEWIIANVSTSWNPSNVTITNSWGAAPSQFTWTTPGSSVSGDIKVRFTYSAVPEATTLLLGFAGLAPVLLQRRGRSAVRSR